MSSQRSTRRKFNRDVVLVGAAAFAIGAQPADKDDPLKSSADALCALMEARYGKHLTAEQLSEVKKSVRSDLARAEFLKRTPLKNSDEPSFVFRADL